MHCRLLLDSWIDVQRRWLYLEGLFIGSPEIQSLMPKESNKFSGLNTEFTQLMNKASCTPSSEASVQLQAPCVFRCKLTLPIALRRYSTFFCLQASKAPKIMEIMGIHNIQQTLERIGTGLMPQSACTFEMRQAHC